MLLPHSPVPSTCPYRDPHQTNLVYAFPSQLLKIHFDAEYIYGFVGWGSAGKVDDVIPSRAVQDGGYALPWQRYDNKMAAICYYGKVMATTRWRLCVTMETLSQHLDDVSSVMHAGCLHADRTIQIHQY